MSIRLILVLPIRELKQHVQDLRETAELNYVGEAVLLL